MSATIEASVQEIPAMFRAEAIAPIPEATARVARAAFPQGSSVMMLRDYLGPIYRDADFQVLFPSDQGQPAWSAWRLAMITVMQYLADLSDVQAAQAVRGRIDWKYALSLPLEHAGVDASVLSEFRTRLVQAGAETMLLERLLSQCQEQGWLKAGGVQRSDSTHVVAAIRVLHRLEVVGETLRAALNSLAVAAPEWLQAQVAEDWFERYGSRMEDYQWPKAAEARQQLSATFAQDGYYLLAAIGDEAAPPWLWQLPAVEVLRQVWVQQFYLDAQHQVHWRTPQESPPTAQLIHSPYDVEARFSTKRETHWVGYKVHLTETSDPQAPHLITQVTTTAATTADVQVTHRIQAHLAAQHRTPATHLLDTGYIDAAQLLSSQDIYGIDIVGPVLPDSSWQARAQQGFDISYFEVNWEQQQARCPLGHLSHTWKPSTDRRGHDTVTITFADSTCQACDHRRQCTRSQKQGRVITLRPKRQHQILQQVRQAQTTASFQQCYATRAGIEGTLSQGIRAFGLRRCRYIGFAKAHLQHLITATAMNVARLVNWWNEVPLAPTRRSQFAKLAPAA
jgi:transposase